MLGLFHQFQTPSLLGVPLTAIALILPATLILPTVIRWTYNRLSSFQNWTIGLFTRQIFSPINPAGHEWALLLVSLMIFFITMNTAGLLPYTFTPTTQLSMNLGFAFPLWLATVVLGMRTQPTHALGHLLPEGSPTPLVPVLILIETTSLFIRPIALGVRLTANLTAGHLLIQLVSTATMTLLAMMPVAAMFTNTLLFLLALLEVAVAMIQAYVFILLLSLYLQENV